MKIPIEKLLIIGGSSKKAGKTSMAIKIIEKYAAIWPLVALKIASYDEFFKNTGKKYQTFTQKDPDINNDSGLMLNAGAQHAIYIKTDIRYLSDVFFDIYKQYSPNHYFICESNTLVQFIKPGLFIFMNDDQKEPASKKPNPLAEDSRAIEIKKSQINDCVDSIQICNGSWSIK